MLGGWNLGVGLFCFVIMNFLLKLFSEDSHLIYLLMAFFNGVLGVVNFGVAFS